jgi:hypothetical protein
MTAGLKRGREDFDKLGARAETAWFGHRFNGPSVSKRSASLALSKGWVLGSVLQWIAEPVEFGIGIVIATPYWLIPRDETMALVEGIIRAPKPKIALVTLTKDGLVVASTEVTLLPPPPRFWQVPRSPGRPGSLAGGWARSL